MKNITIFSGMLLVLLSSLLSAAYIVDFESSGGTNYGEIPSGYQPVAGLTISYTNVGVYSGSGTWNTFQYAGAGNGPQVFSFNKPVAISSVSLCQYDPSAATIIASAYSDAAGTTLLGTESIAMPAHDDPAGQNYVWQSFTGFAQYGQTIRRIEFDATGGINPNAQVDNIVIDSIGTLPGIQSLTQPMTRAIFQRNNQNLAMVPIAGTYTGLPTQIEARAIVMNGYKGVPLDWQIIAASPAGGTFNMTMAVEAGGWYRIEVRAVTHGEAGAIAAVERVGVGDVFITAGQSNSANWGTPAMTPANDIVSAWTGAGWRHAYDPQPVADGTVGGSPWSRLGDMLVNEFDVPVGFISVGVGGTAISRWIPTANDLYPRIRSAISAAGPNGMRAILWHQGESDSTANTTMAVYGSKLNSVITQSRIDAGWTVPWGVALVAFLPSSTSAQQAPIRAGQQNVIDSDPYVFQGPDTDMWLGTTYRSDTVHFNALGLQLHAEGWKKAILSYFRPWDFDQDRYVDLSDFKTFSTHWLSASMPVTAHWQLNEITGLTATDSSGNGYDGTLKNGPAWIRGRTANALSLDGVNDYVEAVGFTGIPGTASRTCMAWVKANASSKDQTILSWGNGANGQKWMFRLQSTGQLAVGVWGGYIYGNAAVADGLWHHVAAVLADDGAPSVNEIKLYVDGIAQTGTYSSEQTIDTAVDQNVQIGSVYTGTVQDSFFGGLIDDVRIYNTALFAQQISELYKTIGDFDQDSKVDLSDLSILSSYWLDRYKPNEARWRYDETTGLEAMDSSGNLHHGTLINNPVWTAGKSGNALSFDGVDDYVEATGFMGIRGMGSRTCAVWIKTNTNGKEQVLLSWGNGSNGQKWMMRLQPAGQLAVGVWGGYIQGSQSVADGQWHHAAVVLTDDGTPSVNEIKLYIDGIAQTGTYNTTQAISTGIGQNVQVGSFYTGSEQSSFFGGLIDDVRIYDAALTPEQVVQLTLE